MKRCVIRAECDCLSLGICLTYTNLASCNARNFWWFLLRYSILNWITKILYFPCLGFSTGIRFLEVPFFRDCWHLVSCCNDQPTLMYYWVQLDQLACDSGKLEDNVCKDVECLMSLCEGKNLHCAPVNKKEPRHSQKALICLLTW